MESKLLGELNNIQAKIGVLRNQRAALESRIAAIWSLPNEILAHIFNFGVMDEQKEATADSDDDGDLRDDSEHLSFKLLASFNVLVSHVCRKFREVAIHTPSLWTQIHIYSLEPPRMDFMRACAERSGSFGLDIMINCEEDRPVTNASIHLLIEILVPCIDRFKKFAIRFYGFQHLHTIMQHLDRPAPQLEVLDISDANCLIRHEDDDIFYPSSLREPLVLFEGIAPKLDSVFLDGVHVAWEKCNFTGLKVFQMGHHARDVRPTYEEFKAIIDASPALHTMRLDGSAPLVSDDPFESSHRLPLQMERLETLHISNMSAGCATGLISLFNSPNLKSLSLTDLCDADYSPFFRRMVGPPLLFPALTALKLSSVDVSEAAFEHLLRACSSLTRLTLYFEPIPLSWLAFLEPEGSAGEVSCPKLEYLRCAGASTYALKQLLEKRRDAGFPIPRLGIDKGLQSWEGPSLNIQWLEDNAAVKYFEPSEFGNNESASDWGTDEGEDEIGGIPLFAMEDFSDEDDDEEYDEDQIYEEDEDIIAGEVDEEGDISGMEVGDTGYDSEFWGE